MMLDPRQSHLLPTLMLFGAVLLPVAPLATNSAYGDTESAVGNVFRAGVWDGAEEEESKPSDIVLNEFLPNPDATAGGLNFGEDHQEKPLGEWIELYNKGDVAQDIAGWYLADASGGAGNIKAVISGTNTDTNSTVIAAYGWLVVYMNKPTLNNTGDEIHLFTPADIEIDSVVYNDPSNACELPPTPGDENSTSTPTGTPGNGPSADCIENQVAPNKSYARIPDGTGAWIDPVPTPGAHNVAQEGDMPLLTPQNPGGSSIQEAELPEIEVSNEPFEIIEPEALKSEGVGGPTDNVGLEVSDEPLEVETGTSTPETVEGEVSDEQLEVVEPTPEPEPESEITPEPEADPAQEPQEDPPSISDQP